MTDFPRLLQPNLCLGADACRLEEATVHRLSLDGPTRSEEFVCTVAICYSAVSVAKAQ